MSGFRVLQFKGSGFTEKGVTGQRLAGGGQPLSPTLSDCRLAKFRGFMINGNYGAVTGWKTRDFACARCECPGYGFFLANPSAVFFRNHLTTRTEFRKMTVWMIVAVDPSPSRV